MKVDLSADRYADVEALGEYLGAQLWLGEGSLSASTYLTAEECRKLAGALLEVADELEPPNE